MCKPSKWDGTGLGATPNFCHTDLYLRLEILVSESWSCFILQVIVIFFCILSVLRKGVRLSAFPSGAEEDVPRLKRTEEYRIQKQNEFLWLYFMSPTCSIGHMCVYTHISCIYAYVYVFYHISYHTYNTYAHLYISSTISCFIAQRRILHSFKDLESSHC